MKKQGRKQVSAGSMHDVRMNIVAAVLIAGLVGIGVRFAYIQVAKAETLRTLAQKRHMGTKRIVPLRGDIVDANGEMLALSLPAVSLYAHPNKLSEEQRTYVCEQLTFAGLRHACGALDSGARFVWLERRLQRDRHEVLLESLKGVDGIGWKATSKRLYPKSALAGQLIGFVGVDGDGLEGIERALNDWLSPALSEVSLKKDAKRRFLLGPEDMELMRLRRNSVQLTIDSTIQSRVELALNDAITEFGGQAAIALVAEADTGAIRAAAIAPEFDPNHFGSYAPSQWRARFVTDAFEPGSTVKPLVLGAALMDGARLHDIVYAEMGKFLVDEHVITDNEPLGWLSLRNVVVRSSNIGIAKIGQIIGREKLYEAYRSYGFGARTEVGLPGEATGILRTAGRWSELDFAAASFGQGLSVSPMQLLQAYLIVANHGERVPPRLVDRVYDATTGKVVWRPEHIKSEVFDDEMVFSTLRSVLAAVVSEGTGKKASVDGLAIGGKTGTAQKPDLVAGGYKADTYVAWFVGLFPIDNPRWVTVVLVDEPEASIYGGAVAAPVFAKVAEAIAIRDGLLTDAQTVARQKQIGLPLPVASIEENGRVGQSDVVPDLSGMSLKTAASTINQLGKSVLVNGSGVVVSQNPAPGTELQHVRFIELTLEEKSA